jgi:ribosome-binding factor A
MKTPTRYKDEKYASLLSKFAAEYFEVESNENSLITITRTDILDKGKRALIFFTTLPRENEAAALAFAKRRRSDFRKFVMSKKSFGFAPSVDFCIDEGEHNRQRIDELLNEINQPKD